MHPKAKKELEKVKAEAKLSLEVRKAQQKAMRKMAQDFKDCLKFKVCPRCGGRLLKTPINWGFFDIFNPFVRRHWWYECTTTLCEFQYKKAPTTSLGPM